MVCHGVCCTFRRILFNSYRKDSQELNAGKRELALRRFKETIKICEMQGVSDKAFNLLHLTCYHLNFSSTVAEICVV